MNQRGRGLWNFSADQASPSAYTVWGITQVPKSQSATGRPKNPEMDSLQSITAWWRRWKP